MKKQELIAMVIAVVLTSIPASTITAVQRQGFPFPPPDGQDFPFGLRGGRGGPGGPNARDIEVVKQFDKNNDGWLNAAERQPARDYARTVGRGGFGFRGPGGPRGFGRGGETGPAAPGKTITPADVKTYPNASFYDESVLRTVFITFEEKDW